MDYVMRLVHIRWRTHKHTKQQNLLRHGDGTLPKRRRTRQTGFAAGDDRVELRRVGDQPVELLERVMEVGDEEQAHDDGASLALGADASMPKRSTRAITEDC